MKETKFSSPPSKKARKDDQPANSLSEKLSDQLKKKTVEKSHEFKTSNGEGVTTKTVEKSHYFSKDDKKLIHTPDNKSKLPSPKMEVDVADESLTEIPGTPQEEKRKVQQAQYKKYLSRGGAKNPGSKVVYFILLYNAMYNMGKFDWN